MKPEICLLQNGESPDVVVAEVLIKVFAGCLPDLGGQSSGEINVPELAFGREDSGVATVGRGVDVEASEALSFNFEFSDGGKGSVVWRVDRNQVERLLVLRIDAVESGGGGSVEVVGVGESHELSKVSFVGVLVGVLDVTVDGDATVIDVDAEVDVSGDEAKAVDGGVEVHVQVLLGEKAGKVANGGGDTILEVDAVDLISGADTPESSSARANVNGLKLAIDSSDLHGPEAGRIGAEPEQVVVVQ